jgi:hypothetical protein
MKYISIALMLLSMGVHAQSGNDSLTAVNTVTPKGLIAWRVGGPDLEKPKKKASTISERKFSTLSIKSVKEELKGIGVYTFTNEKSSILSVQFNSYADQSILIQFVDKAGKVLHSQFITIENDDEDYSLDISTFNENYYHLVISNVKQKRMSMFIIERDKKI